MNLQVAPTSTGGDLSLGGYIPANNRPKLTEQLLTAFLGGALGTLGNRLVEKIPGLEDPRAVEDRRRFDKTFDLQERKFELEKRLGEDNLKRLQDSDFWQNLNDLERIRIMEQELALRNRIADDDYRFRDRTLAVQEGDYALRQQESEDNRRLAQALYYRDVIHPRITSLASRYGIDEANPLYGDIASVVRDNMDLTDAELNSLVSAQLKNRISAPSEKSSQPPRQPSNEAFVSPGEKMLTNFASQVKRDAENDFLMNALVYPFQKLEDARFWLKDYFTGQSISPQELQRFWIERHGPPTWEPLPVVPIQ